MRALVHDPDTPHGLRLGEAPDPEPGPSDAIVQVAATSLNFGEVAFLRERVAPGAVAGWDASGTVVAAAADGSGPPAGARVATFGSSGAWAQQRAASTGELAVLPDAVEFGAAAALPVAGVTALRAVRRLGSVVGRRVLITGASGGVGTLRGATGGACGRSRRRGRRQSSARGRSGTARSQRGGHRPR